MALNILVVDDSMVMRAMIIKTLCLSRLPLQEIHQAENGRQALEVLARNWIDLAFVDINMPVMDGVELVARIREMPGIEGLPVIVVSTENSSNRISVLQGSSVQFVHKPFSVETLQTAVTEMTGVACE